MEVRVIFGSLDNVKVRFEVCAVAMTYKMCPIRESQKREDLINLLIVFKDASNRKLYARANLQVLSCCCFEKVSKTLPDG